MKHPPVWPLGLCNVTLGAYFAITLHSPRVLYVSIGTGGAMQVEAVDEEQATVSV